MKPKHRNIIHRHARLRTGAGVHKTIDRNQWNYEDDMVEMTLSEFRAEHGITSGTEMVDALDEWRQDDLVPALCHHGCEVKQHETCKHGCPSILIRMRAI